jgi:Reverse transcriptase (RNA-dependent DNA polymerase)
LTFRLYSYRRGLPVSIIRILIKLYTDNQVRVLWAGITSDYCIAVNGVKQGGVIIPVLFCVYIDDLLVKLSPSGIGCFIGLNFAGTLTCANDIVLVAPTPTAMRKMLIICDEYAADYDIMFNPDKSKFLVNASRKRLRFYKDMCALIFYW